MQYLKTAKIRAFFILPLLLLMVQFCIVLPHDDNTMSLHDGDDSSQHLSDDGFLEADNEANNKLEHTPNSPAILTTSFHAVIPFLTSNGRSEQMFSAFRSFRTAELFLKRAPPA
jgi:hypothetical protein